MNIEQLFATETTQTENQNNAFVWLKRRSWFFAIVILPTLLATIYYGFIASDVYVSESRFVVKSPDQKRPQLSTLANLVQTTGLSAGQEQANEILEFIRSRDAVRALERNPGIQGKYSSPHLDMLSRFPQPFHKNSFENLFRYYGGMVSARVDSETGTTVLTVKAFSPRDAYEINERLLELSENLVNRLNVRAQARSIAEAQRQVGLATARVKQARMELAQFRNSQEIIDPQKQATGVLEISNALVSERAALQAQLQLMQREAPANPSIPAIRTRISAISAQIASQDNRVVGNGGALASKLGGYENLLVEQEFATTNLNAASSELVRARNEAQRQQFYLERVVDPNLPDMPLLPKRMLSIVVIAAVMVFLYFIGWMVIVGILEHAPDD